MFYLATEPRRKLTSGDKTLIVKHWLAGDSLRQIQDVFRKRGVPPPSTSTGSEVIAEAKRTDPDLESMRQLLVDLRKIGGDVNSALRGCVVLDQLHESGFTMKDWDKVLSLCLEIFAGRPVEVVDPATELLKLEKVTGKTYTELLRDYERMSREVPELSEKIGGLAAKKQGLEQSIRRLEEYARLSEDLRKQDVAPEDVAKFLKVYKDHDQLGLDRYSKVLGGAESLQHALAALGTREKEERARVEALEKQRSLLQQRLDKLAGEKKDHEELARSFQEEAERLYAAKNQAKKDLAETLDLKGETQHILASIRIRKRILQETTSDLDKIRVRWNRERGRMDEEKRRAEEELARIRNDAQTHRDQFDAFVAFRQLLRDPAGVTRGALMRLQGLIEDAARAMAGEETPGDKVAPEALEKAKASLAEMIEGMVKDRMVASWRHDSVKKDMEAARADLASAEEKHRQELSARDASWENRFQDSEASFGKKLEESEAARAKVQQELEASERKLEQERANASSAETMLREQLDSEKASSKKLRDELERLREAEKLVGDEKTSLAELDAHFKDVRKAEIEAQAMARLERLKEREWPQFADQQYKKRIQEGVDFEVNLLHKKRLEGEILPLLTKGIGREVASVCGRCGKRFNFILRESAVNDALAKGAVEVPCPNPMCGHGILAPRGILGRQGPHIVKVNLVDILRQIEYLLGS